MTIQDFFHKYPNVSIAFSGGVDSAYLLYAAKQYAASVHAFYASSEFQPAFELEDAKRFCMEYDIPLTILPISILSDTTVKANPANRCYYCKTAIFSTIWHAAKDQGYSILLDGTNASDEVADRPGMKALSELEVLSPLRICGLTKDMIRSASQEAGLFTWNKPSYACLATRIQTGCEIHSNDLSRIEQAESILSNLGFTDFRVRLFHDAARIQLTSSQFTLAINQREKIFSLLSPFFTSILLDLRER